MTARAAPARSPGWSPSTTRHTQQPRPPRRQTPDAAPPPGPGRPGERPTAVTVKDVAARAGVSVGTVSNVLNAEVRVRPETRARVQAVIAELGFVPNESARHLRAGRSRVIALVVPDIANPFFNDLAAGADDAADLIDAMVVVSSSADSPAREERHLRRLGQQRLLGLAITPMFEPPWELLETIEAQRTPVVLVDHTRKTCTVQRW